MKRHAMILLVLPLVAALALAQTSAVLAQSCGTHEATLDNALSPQLVKSINSTGFAIFRSRRPDGNVGVSPLSAWLTYSILYNDPADEFTVAYPHDKDANNSRDELAAIVDPAGAGLSALNANNRNLIDYLAGDGVQLSTRLWADKQRAIVPDNARVQLQACYATIVYREDSADEIDAFANSASHGSINTSVDRKYSFVPGFDALNVLTALRIQGALVTEGARYFETKDISGTRYPISNTNLSLYILRFPDQPSLSRFATNLTAHSWSEIVSAPNTPHVSKNERFELQTRTPMRDFGEGKRWIFGGFGTSGQNGLIQVSAVAIDAQHIELNNISLFDGWNPGCCVDFFERATPTPTPRAVGGHFLVVVTQARTGIVLFIGAGN